MTYLVDTNVLSELRRPDRAHPQVMAWAASAERERGFISVISILEIERGIVASTRSNPAHATKLRAWLDDSILPFYGPSLLPIDLPVASQCARFGQIQPSHFADALIAATALVHNLTIVTRNTRDFLPFGVRLFNPWDAP